MSGAKRQPTLAMKRKAAQQRDRAQYGAKRDMILKKLAKARKAAA